MTRLLATFVVCAALLTGCANIQTRAPITPPPPVLESTYSDLLTELDAITAADVAGACVDSPTAPACKKAREGIHFRYMRVADLTLTIRATAGTR